MTDARTTLTVDVGQFITGMGQASSATATYTQVVNQAVGAEGKLGSRGIQQRITATEKAVAKARKEQEKYGRQVLQTLEAFIRYNIVNQIFNRITRGIRDATKAAKELELSLAEVQTIGGGAFTNRQLQGEVLDISGDFGLDAAQTAEAVYFALSNRVGDTEESLQFVRESAEFAEGAFIDLTSAVNLTSGVMSAYGETVSSTARINDELFRAIELGRVTAAQLEGNLGSVIGPAADLGIQLDELLVSVDQLTLSGVPIERSMTGIRNVIFSLLKPSDDLSAALNEIGAASVESAIAQRGLLGTVAALADTTSGLGSEIAELFPNIRAFAATGALFRASNGALEEFNNGLEGASKRAQELVRATEAKTLERNLTQFRNIFTTEIGTPIIKAMNDVFDSFISAETAASALAVTLTFLAPPVAALIGAFSVQTIVRFASSLLLTSSSAEAAAASQAALAQRLNISTAAAARLQLALAGLTAAAVGIGLGFALYQVFGETLFGTQKNAQRFREELEKTNKAAEAGRADRIREMNAEIERGIKLAREQRREVFAQLNAINSAYERSAAVIRAGQEVVTESLKGQLSERNSIVKQFLNDIINASERAEQNIRNALDVVRSLERSVSDARFQAQLDRTDDPRRQAQLLQQRSNELLNAARRAEAAGETGEADQLLQDAVQTANQILGIHGQTSFAIQQQNRALAAANQLQAARIKTEERIEASANQQSAAVRLQVAELDQLEAKLLELREARQNAEGFNTEEIDRDLAKVTTRYDELLQQIAENPLAEQLLSQRQLQKLTGEFFNVLAQRVEDEEVSLNVLLETDINNFVGQLQAQLREIPIEVRTSLEQGTGRDLGGQSLAPIIRDFIEVADRTDQEARDRGQVAVEQLKLRDSIEALRQTFISQTRSVFVNDVNRRNQSVRLGLGDPGRSETAQLLSDINDALRGGNLEEALQLLNQADGDIANSVRGQVSSLREQQRVISQLGATSDTATQNLNRLIDALGNIPSGTSGNSRAMGSRILRAGGGGIGTDVVPAMLSPGEFVMNSRATRQFHAQLVAMNAGMQPTIYRQGGGDVTNNVSLGDVVINNPSTPVNGRNIARDIRRELRKGTAQL